MRAASVEGVSEDSAQLPTAPARAESDAHRQELGPRGPEFST